MTDERGLRTTFDSAADLYQQARPDYPEQLYDAMIAAAGLGVDDRLLEIGCATGKATLPLARRGFRITCVEPGPALAAVGRRNLADFPRVEVVHTSRDDSTTRTRRRPIVNLAAANQLSRNRRPFMLRLLISWRQVVSQRAHPAS